MSLMYVHSTCTLYSVYKKASITNATPANPVVTNCGRGAANKCVHLLSSDVS